MDILTGLVLLVIFVFFGAVLGKFVFFKNTPPDPRADDYDDELYFHPINLNDSRALDTKIKVVQLFISCTNLANKDVFSMSDPLVEVFERESSADPWKKINETECVPNDLNPYFCKPITLGHFGYKNQQIRFLVRDVDYQTLAETTIVSDQIGEASTSLHEIIENGFKASLESRRKGAAVGEIQVIAEEYTLPEKERKSIFHFNEVSLKGLKPGLPTYFQIFRLTKNNQKILIYNSEVQQSSYTPRWKSFSLRDRQNIGDVRIYLWMFNTSPYGMPTLLGESQISMETLLSRSPLKEPVVMRKDGKDIAGLIFSCQRDKKPIQDFKIQKAIGYTLFYNRYSFVEYYKQGLEISTICALDMTTHSAAYHLRDGDKPSVMEQILNHFVEILGPLDQDQLFPFYGFGARNSSGNVSPFFALNGDQEKPECHGINELISCYRQAQGRYPHASVSEAQNHIASKKYQQNDFYPLLYHTLDEVMTERQKGMFAHKYYILFVVLTNDDIDIKETVKLIIDCTDLPISIILGVVGEQDKFPKITSLDADESPLISGQRKAKRDIVQVIHFDPKEVTNKTLSPEYLAREVLAEIPAQVCSYMAMNFTTPNNL